MNRVFVAAALVCGSLSSMAIAQQTLVVGAPAPALLRTGTEIPVRLRTELTTERKALRVGQRFEVETSEPILAGGQIAIPIGTSGVGEVTAVRNKGMWGKSGQINVQLLYLRVGDRQIRITGNGDDKGKAGGGAAVAVSALVFLPAGFFMTGTSARMPAGTIIKGFLAEDVPVAFASNTGPAPLVVAAPAAPATITTVAAPPSTVAAVPAVIPAVVVKSPAATATPPADLVKVSAPK